MEDVMTAKPVLPDGLVVVVKQECETCRMVTPVLQGLAAAPGIRVYVQDDASFLGAIAHEMDDDLALSWHNEIETVPTLIRAVDGVEIERTVGWSRDEWERVTGVAGLGEGLPVMRPGCGSMSVDPDKVDRLRALHTDGVLTARRVELAQLDDEMETMFERGWTDGLPVVPPTEERVLRMLEGTTRSPSDVVAIAPPDLIELTVEKIAINAVMAGCKPEYLPWVIAAIEAACTDEFNIHGVLATTMSVGPVIVCNGPGTRAIGMNGGGNVLGQGNRANMTIGRAVQLVIRNVGGGRPGGVDRATHGNPGKLSFCFPEDEVDSPWTPFSMTQGFEAGVNTVTLFAGEGPHALVDQKSRTPESLAASFAHRLRGMHHHKLVLAFDAILVVGPEHARVFADGGWDRIRVIDEINARLQIPGSELVAGVDGIAEGMPAAFSEHTLGKFRTGGLMLVHAGGGAGLFSAIIGGWANGNTGSQPTTREVRP
jgi:thiol-disulfide isomerase/thioredoxin